jgi:hypothetical protein
MQLLQIAVQQGMIDEQQAEQLFQGFKSQDPQAMQALEQLAQQLQGGGGQPMAARLGAKLRKVMELNDKCPEGYEMAYMKVGGKMKKGCKKCGGGKMETGGKVSVADEYKNSKKPNAQNAAFNTIGKEQKRVEKKELGGLITPEVANAFRLRYGGKAKQLYKKGAKVKFGATPPPGQKKGNESNAGKNYVNPKGSVGATKPFKGNTPAVSAKASFSGYTYKGSVGARKLFKSNTPAVSAK